MKNNEKPIGIFDSGLGGLTVYDAVSRLMPAENIIYFGDTARVPYGSKSAGTVTEYSLQVARFLIREDIKLLVIACNTASALALPELQKLLKVPVMGVIEPGAEAALKFTSSGRIGVIGTEGTIKSGAYGKALKKLKSGVKVFQTACPLFVPLVEEGWWDKEVTRLVAEEYFSPLKKARIDTLILGCTHYPILKPVIQKVMGSEVVLVDSAETLAIKVLRFMESEGIVKKRGRSVARFAASDAPDRFSRLAERFLGRSVDNVELVKFD